MTQREGPILDLTLDGEFRRPPRLPWTRRLGVAALLVAACIGALGLAALAFWLALFLIPFAIAAGLVGYLLLRFQIWRLRH